MPLFKETTFRDCPWCGVRSASMSPAWSATIGAASGGMRTWAALICPRCAALVIVEYTRPGSATVGQLAEHIEVVEIQSVPEAGHTRYKVDHVPDDVEAYFSDALRVMEAGVPDAAAVQLRRTLEAAAAHKGISKSRLVDSVKELIAQGYITTDFAQVLDHVRKIGNVGAHHTDERLAQDEVERALRFTTQVLRNLFEVPGELEDIEKVEDAAK